MSIYTIADLHLSLGGSKPMDVFPGWEDYVNRIEKNWRALVREGDTVVLPGDISWAMSFEELKSDFAFIHALPGKKIILKGNHDYWWTTMRKMNTFCEENGFSSISFIQNNCEIVDDIAICGTRSWFFDDSEPHDEKIQSRELGRLRASLEAAGGHEKIVFLHYPPIYQNQRAQNILALLEEHEVKQCFYGHLHGKSHLYAFNGEENGTQFKLISADSLSFYPYKVK